MPEKPLHDVEATSRLEPARIDVLTGDLPDLVAELAAKAEGLGRALHPRTAANLADLVRIMNTYYSNLIEGNNTRPRDIERALAGERDDDKRDLQQEAVAHYRCKSGSMPRLHAVTWPTLPHRTSCGSCIATSMMGLHPRC